MSTPTALRCSQSGAPEAGTRPCITDNCRACDGFSWCWSNDVRVVNSSCRACDQVLVCHPEGIDQDDAACLECDYYLICHANQARDGRVGCLHASSPRLYR